jgi:hypothetical protein
MWLRANVGSARQLPGAAEKFTEWVATKKSARTLREKALTSNRRKTSR